MDHVCPSEDGRLAIPLLGGHRDLIPSHDYSLLLKDRHDVHAGAPDLAGKEQLHWTRTGIALSVVENDLVAGAHLDGEAQTGAVVHGGRGLDGH